MARQQAAHRPVKTTPAGVGKAATQIHFSPELAARAIVFHLADERISSQVVEDSLQATVLRLRRSAEPAIIAAEWAEMTNSQRLDWLLEKTQTTSRLVSDDVSILEPAGKE